jgi:hypothetical protein
MGKQEFEKGPLSGKRKTFKTLGFDFEWRFGRRVGNEKGVDKYEVKVYDAEGNRIDERIRSLTSLQLSVNRLKKTISKTE